MSEQRRLCQRRAEPTASLSDAPSRCQTRQCGDGGGIAEIRETIFGHTRLNGHAPQSGVPAWHMASDQPSGHINFAGPFGMNCACDGNDVVQVIALCQPRSKSPSGDFTLDCRVF
jgi:hypothetical protein